MSHNKEILADLKSGKVITSVDALRDYGCFRLAARIYDLRSKGHNIVTVYKDNRFAHYYLKIG